MLRDVNQADRLARVRFCWHCDRAPCKCRRVKKRRARKAARQQAQSVALEWNFRWTKQGQVR